MAIKVKVNEVHKISILFNVFINHMIQRVTSFPVMTFLEFEFQQSCL